MKVLFVQFANSMFPRFGVSDGYWDAFYSTYRAHGYVRMEDAFEVPKWIAEVCFFLPHDCDRKICWVHHSIAEAIHEIDSSEYDYVLFSVMTCTKGFTKEIIEKTPSAQKFVIGGYDDWIFEAQKTYSNVKTANNMRETAQLMGLEYRFGTDYELFEGWTVLPRLTLSYGCKNNCKFCIVPHDTSVVERKVVEQQVESFCALKFKLIYIDDKTFGQAENYVVIKELKDKIKKYNPDFEGFVVQTTTFMLAKRAKQFKDLGVVVTEIGLETFNDPILRLYRKPSSEKMVKESIEVGRANGMLIIPNIIVGMPEETHETYERTKGFLEGCSADIIGLNMAMYTDYSSPDCVGEVDFAPSDKIGLHRQYWKEFNDLGTNLILDSSKFVITGRQ